MISDGGRLCCVAIALFSIEGSRRLKEPICLENHVFGKLQELSVLIVLGAAECRSRAWRMETTQWNVNKLNICIMASVFLQV